MLQMPRKVKFRRAQKGKMRGIATTGSRVTFGEYGLKATENGYVRSNHLEACRVVVARKMKGAGKLWINIFPHKPITKKPNETRMGKGKGNPEAWVAPVKRGRVLYEMEGVAPDEAREALRLAAHKLPLRTRFVQREGGA